eukprot:488126_1
MKASNLDCTQFEKVKWCTHGECEYRHLSESEKTLRTTPLESIIKQSLSFINILDEPQLIISAGPERSGSTWLYNAIRLLFLHSNQCINSFWIHTITKNKIKSRFSSVSQDKNDQKSQINDENKTDAKDLKEKIEHLLIKTHEYPFTNNNKLSDIMQLKPKIILTHRDLRNVVNSYRRVGWASFLPNDYVSDHLKWTKIATLDLGFEDSMKNQINALKVIAKHIGILKEDIDDDKQCGRWLNYVLMDLNGLKAPINKFGPDNISKLWPSHISNQNKGNAKQLDAKTEQQIFQKYPQFMKLYSYT